VQQQDYWSAEDIEKINTIVKMNCGTIQTLIQAEFADSDYKTIKDYIVDSSPNGLFSKSGIKIFGNGLQTKNGITGEAGCVVVTFDDVLELFLINGNAFDTGSILLAKPLIARK
jgi:lipoate-protein ligase A